MFRANCQTGAGKRDVRREKSCASRELRQKLIIPPTVDVKNDEGALVTIRKISALYRSRGRLNVQKMD